MCVESGPDGAHAGVEGHHDRGGAHLQRSAGRAGGRQDQTGAPAGDAQARNSGRADKGPQGEEVSLATPPPLGMLSTANYRECLCVGRQDS